MKVMEIQKKSKHNYYYYYYMMMMMMMGMDDEDIMIEIFLWLPVKSLIRFKRLSKRWNFLISHKDSYFRCDYLTNITTRGRKRIVGSYDHSPPTMAGFFFQVSRLGLSYERVRFLPTSTEFVKAADKQKEEGTTTTTLDTTTNPFWFLDYESLDRFLLFNCLQYDPAPDNKEIRIFASSNGFLLCSLEKKIPRNFCLVNPVTKEWTALPEPKIFEGYLEVGFVCKGDYPSLNSVEYTIVRATWSEQRLFVGTTTLLLEIFSSDDDQWRQFTCSSDQPSRPFYLPYKHDPVIVNNSDQGGDGIVIYFLAMLKTVRHSVILVFDFMNKDDQNGRGLLQMIETPGEPEEKSGNEFYDHIAEFDGVIHYMRYKLYNNTYMELWVLNRSTKSNGEWFLKYSVSLTKMMEKCPWIHLLWKETFHIQGFHPMNPNLIFLTWDQKMMSCNFESGTLELVCDFHAQNLLQRCYLQYAYQWPCWPPLL